MGHDRQEQREVNGSEKVRWYDGGAEEFESKIGVW